MRAVPVRYWLIGLVVLLVVPLATLSSLVFAKFAGDQRAAAERQLVETTRALAIATEWHVVQTIRQLQLLVPRDGPARFSEQAASAIARGEFLEVAFFDETGRLVASQPYVAPGAVSIATEEFFRRAFDTRGPYVSDFVRSPITGRPGVVLAVPVRHRRVTGVAVGVPDFSAELLDLMLQQRLRRPEGGGAIMDRRGLYIARTLNPEQTVGRRAGAAFLEHASASTEGIVRNVNQEGQTVYGTFVHTSFGWITAIGVPASAIEEPARRGLITMIALSFSGLLVAVGLAALFGHRIASALARLASAASEAGGWRVPPGRPEWITEVDVTRRALVRVAVRVSAEDDTAVLTVADTGVGIAADVIERVFDLFVQAERPLDRADGGLGIGLTLVKALVTLHGGSITAASDGPGRGATFAVRLPSIVPPSNGRVAARAARASVGPRRVLIVEDNADAREMLGTVLSSAGHEVREADTGAAALGAVAMFRPDVGLIDIGLPGVDGYEVARRLRATDGGKGMLLVALTGYGQPEDRRRARAAGFDAHLTKPVLPEQLAEVLEGAHETRG